MKKLEVKTRKQGRLPDYATDIENATTFLRHSEDRIEVKNGESVNIDIYENGALIFSGDKYDLYKKLKSESSRRIGANEEESE